MEFSTYCSFLTLDGDTARDRNISRIHRDIFNLAPDSPSYRNVLINSEPRNVVITSTLDTAIKNIVAMPNEPLCVGNHVKYCDHDYWITDASVDDGVYAYGKMELCTDIVRFISDYDGSIVEYPVIMKNATKFNTGETPNKRLTIPSGQFTMLIPIDKHTILIDNGFRFLIDKRKDYPSAYKVTYVDGSSYGYDDGLLNIVMLQCSLDPDVDNIDLMIADYYNKHSDEPKIESSTISFDYDNPSIKVGGTGTTFTPTIKEDTALPLQFIVDSFSEVQPYIKTTITDRSITFVVSNQPALIGNVIKMHISDANGENGIDVLVKLKGLI